MMRSLLLKLVSAYFGLIRVPASLRKALELGTDCTIITQGSSLVVHAMLLSFARRENLNGTVYCADRLTTLAERDPTQLYWCSISDEGTLAKLVAESPEHFFSTLNIFRARGPIRSTPTYTMSIWRQILLLVGSRFLIVIFGAPIQLPEKSGAHPKHASRSLKLDFYRNLKLVRGAPFQSLETQARSILGGAEFEREIRIIAARLGKSEKALRALAHKAFYQMAANPRAPIYWITAPIFFLIINRLFSQVETRGLDKLREAVRDSTVVLVPMHRSHLDYILLSVGLYESNLNPPIVAAGINLNFWPFGFFIRSLGAYFVKRDARRDRVHALVLRRYVTYLVKRGHVQEFFIEGGRSRSGKMGQPKVGLLATIVNAYLHGLRKNILFVPVSLTYENVIEDEVFGDENTGRSKTKENLVSLLRAADVLKRRYGDVIIRFGDPISLAEFSKDYSNGQPGRIVKEKALVGDLASRLIQTIRDQSDVSLTYLAHTALMSSSGYGMSRQELAHSIRNLAQIATVVGSQKLKAPDFTPSLDSFLQGREFLLDNLGRSGTIVLKRFLNEDVFYIPGRKRFTADFYKNSSIHLFFAPALMALLEL
ncbi:MAG: 1-acyl-sn-glycerol-3-phosphate acyltransferase, partial [Bdellovibrionales bacterium]|nr:1-acyl-sn-glycerol-3-phosphate acyltransferase [Bdellovibrionales bacterium]